MRRRGRWAEARSHASLHCATARISLWSHRSTLGHQGTKSTGVLKILAVWCSQSVAEMKEEIIHKRNDSSKNYYFSGTHRDWYHPLRCFRHVGGIFWWTKQSVLASAGIERAGPGTLIIQPQVSYSSVMTNRPAFHLTVEYSRQIGTKVENTADNQLSVNPKSFPTWIL